MAAPANSKGLLSIRLPVCDVTRANLKQWAMPPIRPPSMEAHTHTHGPATVLCRCLRQFHAVAARPALWEKEGRSIPTSRSQSVCECSRCRRYKRRSPNAAVAGKNTVVCSSANAFGLFFSLSILINSRSRVPHHVRSYAR